jgi:CheY-like chemotaxis protein
MRKTDPAQMSSPDGTDRVPVRVLLAEDDAQMRLLLAEALSGDGYEVVECADGAALLDALTRLLEPGHVRDIDLIVSDIRMPLVTGIEVLEGMKDYIGFPPMILITAFGDAETHAYAQRLGAAALLDKPFEIENLLAEVRRFAPPDPG